MSDSLKHAVIAILVAGAITVAVNGLWTHVASPEAHAPAHHPFNALGKKYNDCFHGVHNDPAECMLLGMGGVPQRVPQ